ncbi:MAG: hypothetical protein JSV96_13320 [Candidatus Aminicenantes bacterium]|nr:MAG: hypothetical protein JSV96_13320 [Candidatus Aminicenantes bacterium]
MRNKYYIFFIAFLPLISLCSNIQASDKRPLKNRVLSLSRGTITSYESSKDTEKWSAKNLITERSHRGWRSKENEPFPHVIIFELAGNAKIDILRFNNIAHEAAYPGVSSKEVQVEFSTASSESNYEYIGSFILEKSTKFQEFSIQETTARWIRLSIKSNYGHPNYTELNKFEAWGIFEFKIFRVISYSIWILGISIILSAFGYYEFSAYVQKKKVMETFKKTSFKATILLGLILMSLGICLSVHKLWLSIILGGTTILLIFYFGLIIRPELINKKK